MKISYNETVKVHQKMQFGQPKHLFFNERIGTIENAA